MKQLFSILAIIFLTGCGGPAEPAIDTVKRDATEQYWLAHRALNLELEGRPQTDPESPSELLRTLRDANDLLREFTKRSGAMSTANVDDDVIAYIARNHKLFAEARRHLSDAELHLARLIEHNETAQGWMASFNYFAEGLMRKSSSLDTAMEKASELEEQYFAAFQRVEDVMAQASGMNETEIKLRHAMHKRYGLDLPALDDSTPQ